MLKFDLFAVDDFEKKTPMEFASMSEVIEFFGHGEFSLADLSLTSSDGVQKLHPRNYDAKFSVQNYAAAKENGYGPFASTILYALGLYDKGPVNDQAKFISEELNMGQSMATSMQAQRVNGQTVFFYHYWDKDLYEGTLDDWLPHKEVLAKRGLDQGALQYENVAVLADPDRHLVAIVDLTGKASTLKELYDNRKMVKGPVVHATPADLGYIDHDFQLDIIMAGPRNALDPMIERIEYTNFYIGRDGVAEEGKGNQSHDISWKGYCNGKDIMASDYEVRDLLRKQKATVYFYPDSKEKLEVFKVDRALMDALGAVDELYYSSGDVGEEETHILKEGDYVAGLGVRETQNLRKIEPEEMRTLRRAKGEDATYDIPF